jgi:galactokinase
MEINKKLANQLRNTFRKEFGTNPDLVFSPGRINLLGEHIDYNDGYVLPAAIQLGIYAAFSPSSDNKIEILATDFNNKIEINIDNIYPVKGWGNYVLSVINQFKIRGITIPSFRMVMGSDLPIGSGLSSSAALEGAISFTVNHLSGAGLGAKQLALLGQAAEHDYPNVKCGIMDQFANMLGREDSIVRIDCKTQVTDYLKLTLEAYSLVLIYSNVQHALTGGEYNERRYQCNKGLAQIKSKTGKVSFREINMADLESLKSEMEPVVYNRCRYVIEEIQRTHLAAEYLMDGSIEKLGALMFETHDGLSELFEVSLPELDWLVNFAKQFDGVAGSRLMGGGFGGCTLNLIAKSKVHSFKNEILKSYNAKWKLEAKAYDVQSVDGTRLLLPQELSL